MTATGRRNLLRPVGALALVVLVNAAVQALLVAVAPPLPLDVGGLAAAAGSGAALFAATAACWWITAGVAGPLPARRFWLLAASGGVVLVAATALPPAVPLVVAAGCAVVASGVPVSGRPASGEPASGGPARRHPWRFAALFLVTALAVVLAWTSALLLGLFVTGPLGSAATWLFTGAGGAALIAAWNALARRDPTA